VYWKIPSQMIKEKGRLVEQLAKFIGSKII